LVRMHGKNLVGLIHLRKEEDDSSCEKALC
jgi:hypothetical protein